MMPFTAAKLSAMMVVVSGRPEAGSWRLLAHVGMSTEDGTDPGCSRRARPRFKIEERELLAATATAALAGRHDRTLAMSGTRRSDAS